MSERVEINKRCQELFEAGIIRRSKSPWSLPIILVSKSNGTILKLNLEKCQWCAEEVFHNIIKMEVIKNWKEPLNVEQHKSFLIEGTNNYD